MGKSGWIILGVAAIVGVGLYYARKYADTKATDFRKWIAPNAPPEASDPEKWVPMPPVPARSEYDIQQAANLAFEGLIAAGVFPQQAEWQIQAAFPTWFGRKITDRRGR